MRSSLFLIGIAIACAAFSSCSKNDSTKTGQSNTQNGSPVVVDAGNPVTGSGNSATSQTPPSNSSASNVVPPNVGNASGSTPVDPNRNGLANINSPPTVNSPPANSSTSPPGLANTPPANGDPGRNLSGTPISPETPNKSGREAREMVAAPIVPSNRAGTEIGDNIPEIEGKDFDGAAFALSDYKGKVVMVDFWGDW